MNIWQVWGNNFVSSFDTIWLGFANFIPKLVAAIIVLFVGILIADLIEKIVARAIGYLKLDSLFRKAGAEEYTQRAGIRLDVGKFIGALVKWFLVVVVVVETLDILQLNAVTLFLQDVLSYLPRIIVAILILLAGFVIGEAMDKIVARSARVAKLGQADFLGTVMRWVIWIFAVLAALYQLQIAALLSETILGGIITSISIALGLAFGLGGQQAAADLIASIRRDVSDKR